MGITQQGLDGALRSLAGVFKGNAQDHEATEAVFQALQADTALVAEIQYNSGVLDVIAGDNKPHLLEKARAVMAKVEAHKAALGYAAPA